MADAGFVLGAGNPRYTTASILSILQEQRSTEEIKPQTSAAGDKSAAAMPHEFIIACIQIQPTQQLIYDIFWLFDWKEMATQSLPCTDEQNGTTDVSTRVAVISFITRASDQDTSPQVVPHSLWSLLSESMRPLLPGIQK